METEPAAPSAPWAPPPRVRPPSAGVDAIEAAAALAEARSAVDAFRSGDADERLVDDDDTRAARRAGVLRFATAAPRPSTGADRAAASLGLDLLVAAPTPAPVRERHRDALYAARCAVGDDLAPPRLGPEPALDYAPALRAIFGGEAAREATFAGRRFTHYLRDARHSASVTPCCASIWPKVHAVHGAVGGHAGGGGESTGSSGGGGSGGGGATGGHPANS